MASPKVFTSLHHVLLPSVSVYSKQKYCIFITLSISFDAVFALANLYNIKGDISALARLVNHSLHLWPFYSLLMHFLNITGEGQAVHAGVCMEDLSSGRKVGGKMERTVLLFR